MDTSGGSSTKKSPRRIFNPSFHRLSTPTKRFVPLEELLLTATTQSAIQTSSEVHDRLHSTPTLSRIATPAVDPREHDVSRFFGPVTHVLGELRKSGISSGRAAGCDPSRCCAAEQEPPPMRTVVNNRAMQDRSAAWKATRDAKVAAAAAALHQAREIAEREEAAKIAALQRREKLAPGQWGSFLQRQNAWASASRTAYRHDTTTAAEASGILPATRESRDRLSPVHRITYDAKRYFGRVVTEDELADYVERIDRGVE